MFVLFPPLIHKLNQIIENVHSWQHYRGESRSYLYIADLLKFSLWLSLSDKKEWDSRFLYFDYYALDYCNELESILD